MVTFILSSDWYCTWSRLTSGPKRDVTFIKRRIMKGCQMWLGEEDGSKFFATVPPLVFFVGRSVGLEGWQWFDGVSVLFFWLHLRLSIWWRLYPVSCPDGLGKWKPANGWIHSFVPSRKWTMDWNFCDTNSRDLCVSIGWQPPHPKHPLPLHLFSFILFHWGFRLDGEWMGRTSSFWPLASLFLRIINGC